MDWTRVRFVHLQKIRESILIDILIVDKKITIFIRWVYDISYMHVYVFRRPSV